MTSDPARPVCGKGNDTRVDQRDVDPRKQLLERCFSLCEADVADAARPSKETYLRAPLVWSKDEHADLFLHRASTRADALRAAAFIDLRADSRFAHIAHCLLARLSVLVVRMRLRAMGFEPHAAFAISPSVESFSLIYGLRTPAQSYAERRLTFVRSGSRMKLLLVKIVALVSGFDPNVAAIVILGHRND